MFDKVFRPHRGAPRAWFVITGALASLSIGVSVAAQTSSPAPTPRISQEVFVTASIGAVPIESLTRTVALITREDLERMGITSVIDGLRFVPGIDPRARGPRDVQTDFSIRGSTFGQNLVLVDGLRLNNSQSGHHNGEIPVAPESIDRVEVVYGAGSAVHGADALGGAINVIARRGTYAGMTIEAGQYGYASASGSVSGYGLPKDWSLSGWGSRSSGFMFDRDFAQGGGGLRGTPATGFTVDIRHQRKAFGANGFYGNAPSKEWTDQTLASTTWQRATRTVATTIRASVVDHHDHFLWDIQHPEISENRHHTDAADLFATVAAKVGRAGLATVGASAGGDWVTSTNLKDHDYSRASIFGELLSPIASNTTLQSGLRLDIYSTFGQSLSPSVSVTTQATRDVRIRASASHAFRIPTFTELYYKDPGNLGTPDLRAEHGWSVDGSVEWIRRGWTLSFSPFRRWDEDVIDWVKENPQDLWRSTNVRDVTSTGFETSLAHRWGAGMVRLYYAGLEVDAPTLDLLSKYVLEYAHHQTGASLAVPIGGGFRTAINIDHRTRLDGQSYELVSARLSRAFGHADLFVDGSNLMNEDYHEITGVAMPGRWVTAGISLR